MVSHNSKPELKQKLFEIQGGKCFICGEKMDLRVNDLEIDHIIPRARGGKDEENNYALVHKFCNRNKLDSDLRVARCVEKYEKIKNKYSKEGPNRPNLKDFLLEFGGEKYEVRVKDLGDDFIEYKLEELKGNYSYKVPLYFDKLANLKYFFLLLPIEYLFHDEKINPRGIAPRIRGLIEDFLTKHPQLHISLAHTTLENHRMKIQVFDGQHKLVAQMLLGVKEFPVRVFLNPDLDLLLETNTRAGTTLRQVAFDKSVQRWLGSQLYWEKIDEFRKATQRAENDLNFSELDLINFFKGQHREIRRYILDDIRTYVIHNSENKLKDYIEFGGKSKEKPLSYSTIERTFFSFFIYKAPMKTPLNYKLEIGENPRQLEKEQLIRLMNIFAEEIFVGKYDFDRGTYQIEESLRKGENIPEDHLRAVRMAREEILYNILRYVRDCIKRFYLMQGRPVEDNELFQQKFPEVLWNNLIKIIRNIGTLPIWINKDPTVSASLFGGKLSYDYWKHIFDTGCTPVGQKVLAEPLNLDNLLN